MLLRHSPLRFGFKSRRRNGRGWRAHENEETLDPKPIAGRSRIPLCAQRRCAKMTHLCIGESPSMTSAFINKVAPR